MNFIKRYQNFIFLLIILMIFSVSSCVKVDKKDTITFIDGSTGLPVVNLKVNYDGDIYKTDFKGQITLNIYESNSQIVPEAPYILKNFSENIAELDYDMNSNFTGFITLKSDSGFVYRIISTNKYLRTLIFETQIFDKPNSVNFDKDLSKEDEKIFLKEDRMYKELYVSKEGRAYLGNSQNFDSDTKEKNTLLFVQITDNGNRKISFAVLGNLPEKINSPWYIIDLYSDEFINDPFENFKVIYDVNGKFVEKAIF